MVLATKLKARLFRNNVGLGYVGKPLDPRGDPMILQEPRPIKFGLAKGSSDLIGWTPVTITPEMVGRTIPVFTSIEVKMKHGRVSPEQQAWLDAVQAAGGIANVCRSEETLPMALQLPEDQTQEYDQRKPDDDDSGC